LPGADAVLPYSTKSNRRWFLVAWDTAREDWRIYRVDRMALKTPNGRQFPPRDPPGGRRRLPPAAGRRAGRGH
jgi:predicted DNA-binding transcriptional regulator YafY